jgi:hypothetical protein
MANLRAKLQDDETMASWDDPILAEVVTLAEASLIVNRHSQAIKQAIYIGKVKGRRARTGGTWLISLPSLIAHYEPKTQIKDILTCLRSS